jgi:hypothetical protein
MCVTGLPIRADDIRLTDQSHSSNHNPIPTTTSGATATKGTYLNKGVRPFKSKSPAPPLLERARVGVGYEASVGHIF